MQQFAFYLLKVIACSGILLLYYRLALRNKRFHYYNRFYLLATIAASLLLPLLNINWFTINSNNDKAIALMNVMYVQGGEVSVNQNSTFSINWQQAPAIIYTLVSLVFIGLILWRVQKIYAFKKQYSTTSMGEFDFINTDLSQAPFSFLQNLFWRSDIDLNETTGRQILQHELTHIRQKHTWDKLCMQLVLAVCWINPFYWFIQKELYLLHEFIADEKAIENNDGAAFAAMLLTSQYGKSIFSPAQSFAYSPIKRRLYMLTNLTKPRYSYARRLMVLPLLASVVMLFAFRLKKDKPVAVQDVFISTPARPVFKVIVDAGHGGTDDGLRVNGITEKDITLRIAQKLKELSVNYNVEVVLTRNNNALMSDQDRIAIAQSQSAGAFISLHVDYSKTGTQKGMGVLISPVNKHYAECRLLGSAVLENLSGTFEVNNVLRQRATPIAVLNNNPLPAILLECGVMTNARDFKNVTDDAGVTAMAGDILQGIVSYANHTGPVQADEMQNIFRGSPVTDTTKPVVTVTGKEITITYNRTDSTNPSKKPLIVIDDKIDEEGLYKISPQDIDRIMVLKDRSAIDKYGDKGANGVVEVYTKDYRPVEITIDNVRVENVKNSKPASVTLKKGALTLTADTITWVKGNGTFTVQGGGADSANEKVYVTGIEPAHFPGGKEAWQKYLNKQLNINLVSDKGGPVGEYVATVSFTVDEEGNLSNFKIVKDAGYGTGGEAVRVIQRGPKWVPAKQNGRPVKVTQQQNVTWSISNG